MRPTSVVGRCGPYPHWSRRWGMRMYATPSSHPVQITIQYVWFIFTSLLCFKYSCNTLLQNTIDYFKMDIEGHESQVFENIFQTDVLSRVKQLSFEIHPGMGCGAHVDKARYYRAWDTLVKLETFGFRIWTMDHNPHEMRNTTQTPNLNGRFCCSNLHYVNTNFLSKSAM